MNGRKNLHQSLVSKNTCQILNFCAHFMKYKMYAMSNDPILDGILTAERFQQSEFFRKRKRKENLVCVIFYSQIFEI